MPDTEQRSAVQGDRLAAIEAELSELKRREQALHAAPSHAARPQSDFDQVLGAQQEQARLRRLAEAQIKADQEREQAEHLEPIRRKREAEIAEACARYDKARELLALAQITVDQRWAELIHLKNRPL